jgi:dTDP-4-amino-4,6-dideoxygalactose transaminase
MKEKKNKLAINGGTKIIKSNYEHAKWPTPASQKEITQIGKQRNLDIGIKGRTGPIKKFEEMFLRFMDNKVKYAITFNSGTSGLLAAYVAVGIEESDEVIGPALTYHAALSPLHILKAKVVLADVEIDSKCISPESIEKLITPKTKAITVVHQWGHPASMDKIMEIAKKKQP